MSPARGIRRTTAVEHMSARGVARRGGSGQVAGEAALEALLAAERRRTRAGPTSSATSSITTWYASASELMSSRASVRTSASGHVTWYTVVALAKARAGSSSETPTVPSYCSSQCAPNGAS